MKGEKIMKTRSNIFVLMLMVALLATSCSESFLDQPPYDRYANMASTRFLTSSSFLSLNNIRVGYTFPKKWMEKIKINSLNIYVSADNLAIWSARKGYNPMSDFAATTDSYQYTPLSTIMGGIKLQF